MYGFETGLFPNILFDSTFRFKGIQISDQNSFNFLLPIKSKYLCKTKPQINSGLLVRLMNHNESFYELSLNFKHVIKHKSVSKNHFEYIPVYLVIFFFFWVTCFGAFTSQPTDRNAAQQSHLQTVYKSTGIRIAETCTKWQIFGDKVMAGQHLILWSCWRAQAEICCCSHNSGFSITSLPPVCSLDLMRGCCFPQCLRECPACGEIPAGCGCEEVGWCRQVGRGISLTLGGLP